MPRASLADRSARAHSGANGWGDGALAPVRRSRGRVLAGVALTVIGGWIAASAYASVGHRVEVLAIARGVAKYHAIGEADLTVVRVAADPQVRTMPAHRRGELIGRVASTGLVEGSLLTESQLLPASQRVIADGDAMVGTLLGAGDAPDRMAPGDDVQIIVRSPVGQPGVTTTIVGWVAEVTVDDAAAGQRRVSVVVPAGQAALVSAASSDKRVSVVVVGTCGC